MHGTCSWCIMCGYVSKDSSNLTHTHDAACRAKKIGDSSNVGCTLSPSAFGKSLGRELPETRLGECHCLHSCRELSIHKRREQGKGVQTRALLYQLIKILVFFLFQNFGVFSSKFWFFRNFDLSFSNVDFFFPKITIFPIVFVAYFYQTSV